MIKKIYRFIKSKKLKVLAPDGVLQGFQGEVQKVELFLPESQAYYKELLDVIFSLLFPQYAQDPATHNILNRLVYLGFMHFLKHLNLLNVWN